MMTNTQARRHRRQTLAARMAGRNAALSNKPSSECPYTEGSPRSVAWLSAYAIALSDLFINEEPPKGLTL